MKFCRRLLQNDATSRIPVLMMSGHAPEMAKAAATLDNVIATIEKTVPVRCAGEPCSASADRATVGTKEKRHRFEKAAAAGGNSSRSSWQALRSGRGIPLAQT